MICFLHVVLLFAVLTNQEVAAEGDCKCAVFSTQTSELIIERSIRCNVTCDAEGQEKCQQLCVALAENAREDAPHLICEKLGTHVENLEVAVYAKVCDASVWKFTGLKATDLICCHEGKSTACKEPVPMIEN